MAKFVAYYRVSTKRQGDSGLGLEGQRAVIDYFARNEEVVNSYQDIASGKTIAKRPQLEMAIEECVRNGYVLIVAKADRLSRSVRDALEIYDRLGGKLYCCDCPNTDRFTLTILFAVAERERELIGIRTAAALDAKRKRMGVSKINGRSKGVDNSESLALACDEKKRLAVERNSPARTLALRLRRHGSTLVDIAETLNQSGMRTTRGMLFIPKTISRLVG